MKKNVATIITICFIAAIVIAVVIFLVQQQNNDVENPTPTVTPSTSHSQTNEPTQSQNITEIPLEGLNEKLADVNNPITITLNSEQLKIIDASVSSETYALVYFPDRNISNYENGQFILKTSVFHETNNYIGTITIVSDSYVKAGYLLADKDGKIYFENSEKNQISADVSLRIINRYNPITQQQADDIEGLVNLTNPWYVLDERDDLYILSHVKTAMESLLTEADRQDSSLNMHVASGYRDYASQKQSFDYWVNRRVTQENMTYEQAYDYTAGRVAIPGCSEHHNGLTVDLISYGYMLDESSKDAPYAKWLKDNSYKFGFTIRYEEGKEQYTHITLYEPWHIRYVGLPTAYYLYANNLCMEEFYETLINEGYLDFEYEGETYRYIYSKTYNIYINQNIMDIVQYSSIASGVEGYVLLCKIR
jgi:LAS superfamily LD-carboxypeptidase LdcB